MELLAVIEVQEIDYNVKIKMIRFIFLFLTAINILFVKGQDFYRPIQSEGEIPVEFTQKPGDKLNLVKQNNDKSKSYFDKRRDTEFFIKSNYILDYYYRSGKVCFNDSLNKYVNKIAGYLLKDDEELRSEINIYILKSPKFNAFVTGNGTIFINIGLLAKIQSESQLAFVMAHEIVHFIQNHTYDAYIEHVKSKSGKDAYRYLNYDQKLMALSQYSQEQEFFADSLGYTRFFSKTDYTDKGVNGLFNTMLYSYLPLGNHDTIVKFIESLDINFPDDYRLNEINDVITYEDYIDSLSSHPNIKKRKENLDALISVMNRNGICDFVVSKTEFERIQDIAQNELTHLYLQSQLYEDAILNSHYLLQENRNNKFAELSIGVALMQLTNYKANNDFFYIHKDYVNIQGSAQNLYFLLEKISETELGIIALLYNLRLKQKYPDCAVIDNLLDMSFKTLIVNIGFESGRFSDAEYLNSKYFKQAVSLYIEDENFRNHLKKYEQIKKEIQIEKEELIHDKEKRKLIAQKNKIIQKKGFALGIDTIVIVNPLCINANYWKRDHLQLDKADSRRYKLIDAILSNSEKMELNTTLLDLKYLKSEDIEAFNDYCRLSDWFNEKSSHYSDKYFVYNSIYTGDLIKKYNTRYFAWLGLYEEKQAHILGNQNTVLDFYLFNIETGEMLLSQREWIKAYENEIFINTAVKKILHQIKNK